MAFPKILLLSGVRGDTRRYRTVHPYEQLRLIDVDCTLSHISDPGLRARARQVDIVLLHRSPWDSQVKWLVETTRQRGGLVIQDTDDLIFDPAVFQFIDSPDFADPVRAALYQEDLRRNRATLDACDAVIAATDYLADRARALGKPAWVHRNAFSLEMLDRSEIAYRQRCFERSNVVIGYASGTPTHNRDFALVRPALQEILRRYPQVELHLIGRIDPGDGWSAWADRIHYYPLVPWRELPVLLAGFDINLAPLRADNPFGQSKSEIKFMEAALLRLPTIASPTAAFRYAIRSGETGLLAGDWLEALEMLVTQPRLRHQMGEQAYADVVARYHPRVRASELVSTLNAIAQERRSSPIWEESPEEKHPFLELAPSNKAWVPVELEQSPPLHQLAIHNLLHRGPGTLLLQIWVFLRRFLSPIIPYGRR